jgi:translocator protein
MPDSAVPSAATSRFASSIALGIFGSLTAAAAVVGTVTTRSSVDTWYRGLRKPSFTPPNAVFPIVWSGLYALIALSGWRVWKAPRSRARNVALGLWGLKLVLNAAWSPLFFGLRRPRAALVDIVGLGAALGAYTACAVRVDRPAAGMMLPYLGWVGFATALNAEIARRNR